MWNPLAKIGAGVKYLAEHIWGGLKTVFGASAKSIADDAMQSAKTLLTTEVGQFIRNEVAALESSDLSGSDRFSKVFDATKSLLTSQGKEMKDSWLQWAIQTIFLFVRGLSADALSALGNQQQ